MANCTVPFARGSAEFTMELIEKLKAAEVKTNVLISPFSIQTCMALAFSGANGDTATEIANAMKYNMALAFSGANGDTATEIANAMKYNIDTPEKIAESFHHVLRKYQNNNFFKIANKIYIKQGHTIKPDYAHLTKEKYHAEAENINFSQNQEAAESINSWVENKTSGKITKLIASESLDASTRLILLNAMHFKGEWQEKFNLTEEGDFWLNKDECAKIQYMHQIKDLKFGCFKDLECKALEMPFKDSDLSMFVLLPNDREGLMSLVENLKSISLLDLSAQLREFEVRVRFPKFKIEFSVELTGAFQEMGICKAFTPQADLSNMLDCTEGLYISDVYHKTSIEVNEQGSESAATTAKKIVATWPPKFDADHPFLYVIWNRENILFAGAFVNPPIIA